MEIQGIDWKVLCVLNILKGILIFLFVICLVAGSQEGTMLL